MEIHISNFKIHLFMKAKLILLNLLVFTYSSAVFSNNIFENQNVKTIEGVFDGHEDYGYNFITINLDDGSEHTITFQNINEGLLSQFDLNSDTFIGKKFKITYQVKIKKTKDEYGFEDEEEILTVTNLEEL